MKYLIILFSLPIMSFAQDRNYQDLFSNNVTYKKNYVLVEKIGLKKIVIPFYFDKTTTSFKADSLLKISPKKIRKIEYIYYVNKDKKHQNKLNTARIDTLINMFKKRLKHTSNVQFSTIILSNEHSIKTQFTGFVITSETSSKENFEIMKSILKDDKTDNNKPLFELVKLKEYNYILPYFHENYSSDRLFSIIKVLSRNEKWNNKVMVVDVTGSMTPYIGQYLLWLKMNFNKDENQQFVFFNDGNDNIKRSANKEIGNTGGIYYAYNQFGFKKITQTINKAMINGNGGDCPENNIEALIAAENRNSKSENIIMVADNFATPRDMKLISQLSKPVKIILCGVENNRINPAYLTIAYSTGGSIHTMESDIKEICKNKEGEEFTLFNKKYVIRKGEVLLKKSSKSF